ncbi:MAG: class I SAM-dependent methyltransferase [Planctomycetota bacterium]|nr:MAG: class I SAM-dependent methyltransferase [Planctomycetota bacterium]
MSLPAADWRPRRAPGLRLSFAPGGALHASGPGGVDAAVDPSLIPFLCACDGTRSLAEHARTACAWPELSGAARLRLLRLVAADLCRAGVLRGGPPGDEPLEPYFRSYSHLGVHRAMIADRVRTDAFRRALEAVVRPGDVVLDVGSGTGILSLFASRAGAGEVHGIERAALVPVARRLVEANGVRGVEFHACAAEEFPPRPADVVVSEWLGQFAIGEGMFPAVATVRDRCLRPGGRIVPAAVRCFLAPFAAGGAPQGTLADWLEPVAGLDLRPLLEEELSWLWTVADRVDPSALLAPAAEVGCIDGLRDGPEVLRLEAQASFAVERAARLGGLCGWFVAELAPGVVLSTAPDAPPTHWEQHVFPTRPWELAPGDRLELGFRSWFAPEDPRTPRYALDLALQRKGRAVARAEHRYNHPAGRALG